MKLQDACKIFDDIEITHPLHPTLKDLLNLKKDIEKERNSKNLSLREQYAAALEVIILNIQLQEKNSKMYADISNDGKISVSLLQPPKNDGSARSSAPSLKKIFTVEKQGNTSFIHLKKDSTDLNAPSDDEIAQAVVHYAKAMKSSHVVAVLPDTDKTLSSICKKIKVLCQKEGIAFFRQTEAEKKQMIQISSVKEYDQYARKMIAREAILDKEESSFSPILASPKPSPIKA